MSNFKNIKTSKINTGIYSISREGRVFHTESIEGEWLMIEMFEDLSSQYVNHFKDLKSCKIAVNDYFAQL